MLSSVTITSSTVSIIAPDGSSVGGSTSVGKTGGFLDTRTLPVDGTYTIAITPNSTYTGSMTVTLYDVPADATGTITIGGAAATVTTTVPGQNADVTFAGTTGQRISLLVNNVTTTSSYVSILNPNGSTLASPLAQGTSGTFVDTRTLAQPGPCT